MHALFSSYCTCQPATEAQCWGERHALNGRLPNKELMNSLVLWTGLSSLWHSLFWLAEEPSATPTEKDGVVGHIQSVLELYYEKEPRVGDSFTAFSHYC